MNAATRSIANWGNFPRIKGKILSPETTEAVAMALQRNPSIIARGNGRSYGDAGLGEVMLSTLRLNRLLEFDAENGIIDCESGVLLADLLKIIVPKGWFFKVTPGTAQITVGGAIAADVHGKNHTLAGCFSNALLSFSLMTAPGEILECSRTQNVNLFWQTCGGMGWTGIILRARFQLMPIASTFMVQKTVHFQRLSQVMAILKSAEEHYAAAWLSGSHEGGGIVFLANHDPSAQNLEWRPRRSLTIPFWAPNGLLNRFTIPLYHFTYRNTHPEGIKMVHLSDYFYPLDKINHWNRLYGPRGFIQYQFLAPEKTAETLLLKILDTVAKSNHRSFLSVLKRHGPRPIAAIHSFPDAGYSLAMDFPRKKGIFDLIRSLDAIVAEGAGKIYLAKDACSGAKLSQLDPFAFGSTQFMSVQRHRLQQGY